MQAVKRGTNGRRKIKIQAGVEATWWLFECGYLMKENNSPSI